MIGVHVRTEDSAAKLLFAALGYGLDRTQQHTFRQIHGQPVVRQHPMCQERVVAA